MLYSYNYANLFDMKFYTVEKFTLGHVGAHGAAGSAYILYACAAQCISAHVHILADHVTLSIS